MPGTTTATWSGAVSSRLLYLIPVSIYCAIVLGHSDAAYFWDSWIYFSHCIEPATDGGIDLLALNCVGHPSAGSFLLPALVQFLLPGNRFMLGAANAVLGALAILAFMGFARASLGEALSRVELSLLGCALAVSPLALGTSVSFNADFGVYAFFMIFIYLLTVGRLKLAMAAGLFLVFSKEFGAALYVLSLGLYLVIWVICSRDLAGKEKLLKLIRLSGLALPGVVFVIYYLVRFFGSSEPLIWSGPDKGKEFSVLQLLGQLFSFSITNPTFVSYSLGIYLKSFNWVLTFGILIYATLRGQHLLFARPWPRLPGSDRRTLIFLFVLLIISFLLLTRVVTFVNLRYFLPLHPLLLLAWTWSIRSMIPLRWLRAGVMALFVVLQLISAFRTVDPVSRALFGTWKFGDHEMLIMTGLTNECCGLGRDQLAYNLEHLKMDGVMNEMLRDIKANEKTTIVVSNDTDWWILERINRDTYQRTLRKEGSFKIEPYRTLELFRGGKFPRIVYFLDMPNVESSLDKKWLNSRYASLGVKKYGEGGYWAKVYKLILRKGLKPSNAGKRKE